LKRKKSITIEGKSAREILAELEKPISTVPVEYYKKAINNAKKIKRK
jgi:hypothetical protein